MVSLTLCTSTGTRLESIPGQLRLVFNTCCDDFPGAVAVRQSYQAYQAMSKSDYRDWEYQKFRDRQKRSTKHATIAPHSYYDQPHYSDLGIQPDTSPFEDTSTTHGHGPSGDLSGIHRRDAFTDDSSLSDSYILEIIPELKTIDGSSRLFSAQNPLYPLPLDQEEFGRLGKQHMILKLAMWGLPVIRDLMDAVLSDEFTIPKAALDLGCGSGQWAFDMVAEYDNLRIDAVDLVSQITSQLQGQLLPQVVFRSHDINEGLKPFYGEYDIVHARCIASGLKSYRQLLVEAFRCLKQGGLAIFIEDDFDLWNEDRTALQSPATEDDPNGSWLQRWLQAIRHIQVNRCGIKDSDDSPETLDKGLWQLEGYDPDTCGVASIFAPIGAWTESDISEEALHYHVTGVLMRQDLKMFINSTEHLLVESGMASEQITEWKLKIRDELNNGDIKTWKRWRIAWGRVMKPTANLSHRLQRIYSKPRKVAREELRERVKGFNTRQCICYTREEALQHVEYLSKLPYSTWGRF
ncbi:hypothetical protein CPB86DRAFT_180004 [Serendipita vermifera]|nr:hypothetical protein CPB86DRAFT_180004 [Serendipita vermifera]